MSDIDPFLAEKYKMARVKVVDKKTVNRELSLASQVYKKATEWKKYDGLNPFEGVRFKINKGRKPGSIDPGASIGDERRDYSPC